LAIANTERNQQQAQSRPAIPITMAYTIEYREGSAGAFSVLRISEQGAECHAFDRNELLYTACNLTVNTDPALIASDAQGRLNTEYTAAFEAIVWRARLTEGPSFCRDAGLLDEQLRRCEAIVRRAEYVAEFAGFEVRVPASSS
jgi:hypothetical protein